jgi:signal transduction histidine kinase
LIFGCTVTLYVGKLFIRPIQTIRHAFDALSKGNFEVSVPTNQQIDDIREMAVRFNAMVYDLSHIETLRTDFVANVSHEFKTPISAIEGYAMLLQDPGLSVAKHQHYVSKILENSRRLSNLSSNILTLSKLENQEIVMHQKEFRLDEQLRKSVLLLEPKWAEKEIEFDIELPRYVFCGNEGLLDQVWTNLIDNAIKHSPKHSVITISIVTEESQVEVSIVDHGDGMNETVQKHMFDKFYQGDPSHTGEGNGLGLALVARIVELCHGSIAVTSEVGCGTCIRVKLPNSIFTS